MPMPAPHEDPNRTASASPPNGDTPTHTNVVQTTPPHHLTGGCSRTPDPMPVMVGRFQLGEELARGGMGVVYRASEPSIGREVAVKLVRPEFRSNPGAVVRFLAEA